MNCTAPLLRQLYRLNQHIILRFISLYLYISCFTVHHSSKQHTSEIAFELVDHSTAAGNVAVAEPGTVVVVGIAAAAAAAAAAGDTAAAAVGIAVAEGIVLGVVVAEEGNN